MPFSSETHLQYTVYIDTHAHTHTNCTHAQTLKSLDNKIAPALACLFLEIYSDPQQIFERTLREKLVLVMPQPAASYCWIRSDLMFVGNVSRTNQLIVI